jgi:predicted RNA-binding Zn-ribbon protein involved in translation (DUF1610 family)
MGFKCSVLGHRFEEPGLVHEREPRGDDVITIRRKVMVCTLCGEQQVLAENKEITKGKQEDDEDDKTSGMDESIDNNTDTDGAIDDSTRDIDDTTGETDEIDSINTDKIDNGETDERDNVEVDERGDVEVDERGDSDGGERGRDEPPTIEETSETRSGTEGIDMIHEQDGTVDVTESSLDAQQDDGIVLSDGEEGRRYGEWPDKSGETETDCQWDPDGLQSQSASASTDFETNGHTDSSAIDAETDTGEIITDGQSDSKAEQSTTEQSTTEQSSTEEFYCPSCGFTVTAPDSAFRSGDSCPECRKEYLIERE